MAEEVSNAQEEESVDTSTLAEPELFDVIVDFIKSKKLKDLEDEGMSTLMLLLDIVEDLLNPAYSAQAALEE